MRLLPLALVTAVLAGLWPTGAAARPPRLTDSIRPLVWTDPDTQTSFPHCTAAMVSTRLHLWLTAAHCAAPDGITPTIDGMGVRAVKVDPTLDLALLSVPGTTEPALPLRHRAPGYEDVVVVAGYPMGWTEVCVFHGLVSAPLLHIGPKTVTLLQGITAPGLSGSPALIDGELIGVVLGGWTSTPTPFSPVTVTARWEDLTGFLGVGM